MWGVGNAWVSEIDRGVYVCVPRVLEDCFDISLTLFCLCYVFIEVKSSDMFSYAVQFQPHAI